jgi:hypothetical protein
VLLAGGLGTWVVLEGSRLRAVWVLCGLSALVLLATGLLGRRQAPVGAALLVLGTAYGASLIARAAPLDPAAPVFGGGLLMCGELAWLSQELRVAPLEAGRLIARLGRLLAVALAGVVVAALALAAAAAPVARSVPVTVIGAAAAAAALWLIALIATRASRSARRGD